MGTLDKFINKLPTSDLLDDVKKLEREINRARKTIQELESERDSVVKILHKRYKKAS